MIPSLQVSYGNRSLDLNQWGYLCKAYDLKYSYTLNNPKLEKSYPDFNAGLLFTYLDKLFIGSSVFHVSQPDVGFAGSRGLPNE